MVSYLGNGITFPIVRENDIIGSGIAFPVVGAILLVLRLLAHRLNKTRLGLPDLFGFLSWLAIVGIGALFIWSASLRSLGYPAPDRRHLDKQQSIENQTIIVKTEYIFLILMSFALGTTKLSILFFFRKLFVTHRRTFWDYFTLALIALVCLWTIAFVLASALTCGGHATAFWDFAHLNIRHKYCLNTVSTGIIEQAYGGSDLVLDVLCILLPFPVIWRLKLALRQKLGLTAIFLVGIMTIAASVARLVIWVEVENTEFHPIEDANLAVALALYWGMVETGLAFIASQMPALGTFLNKSTLRQMADSIRSARNSISLRPLVSRTSDNRDKFDLEA